MAKTSQEKEVLKYLQDGNSITSMKAIELFGATRLSAIIFNLKEKGYDIDTEMQIKTNRYGHITQYAKYVLKPSLVAN